MALSDGQNESDNREWTEILLRLSVPGNWLIKVLLKQFDKDRRLVCLF